MNTEYTTARDAAFTKAWDRVTAEWNIPDQTMAPMLFSARTFWDEAADWGRAWESPAVKEMRTAIREVLGAFALWNDEDDSTKWPKYIHTCEQALSAYDVERAKGAE